MQMNTAVTRSTESILQTNKLIKNTYMLLSMTLIFSGVLAYLSIVMNASHGIAFAAIQGLAIENKDLKNQLDEAGRINEKQNMRLIELEEKMNQLMQQLTP